MRMVFESAIMWLLGFFTAPLIAGRAFFFHASACRASKSTVDNFIANLHPFIKYLVGSLLYIKFSTSIVYNGISLVVTSILPLMVILIFLGDLLESEDYLRSANALFWLSLSIVVLVRLWFFGYKLRKIQMSLNEKPIQD